MDIGTGIAIAGVWVGAGIVAGAKTTTSQGFTLAAAGAFIMTCILLACTN